MNKPAKPTSKPTPAKYNPSVEYLVYELGQLKQEIVSTVDDKLEEADKSLSEIKVTISKVEDTLASKIKEAEDTLSTVTYSVEEIVDHVKTITKGEPGENANEEAIEQRLLAKIPTLEEIVNQINTEEIAEKASVMVKPTPASLKIIKEEVKLDKEEIVPMLNVANNLKDLKLTLNNITDIGILRAEISRNKAYQQVSGGGFNNIAQSGTVISTGLTTLNFVGSTVTQSGQTVTITATGGTGTVTSVDASGGTTGLTFTGGPITTSGTLTLGGTLGVANGGTGTGTTFTSGSVIFADGSGVYAQDNANFFWDDTNNFLGLGTTAPARALDIQGSGTNSGAARIVNTNLTSSSGGGGGVTLTHDSGAAVLSGDRLGYFLFGGSRDATHVVPNTGGITCFAEENFVSGTNQGTGFRFETTANGTASRTAKVYISNAGNLGIGQSTPTAYLHIKAGTASASTAPIKLTSGTLNTTAEVGAIEFLTDKYYGTITTGAARKEFTLNDAALTSGRVPIVTTNGRLTDDSDLTFATDTLTATKFSGALNGTVGATTPSSGAFTTVTASSFFSAVKVNTQEYRFNGGSSLQWRMISTINGAADGDLIMQHTTDDFATNFTNALRCTSTGNVGIQVTSPTAYLHLKAGTATASTAPLKFNSGTLNTTAEAGAVEFLTDKYYATITTGAARKELTLNDAALTSGRVPFATTNGRLTDDSDMTFATDTLTVTKIVGSTSVTTPQVFYTPATVTVTSNAGTVTRANRINNFTNSSAATMTITMSTTSAVDGDMVMVVILDFSAAAQTITWINTENSTVTAPTTSNGSTTLPLTVGFKWNAGTSKWRCIASC